MCDWAVIKLKNMSLPNYYKQVDGELWLIEDDRDNLRLHYKVKNIISLKRSPFQQVDIVELYDFGKSLVLDGAIQSTQLEGYIYNEMITHVPIVTHNNPEKVLVIGGGDCGAVNEILKYETPRIVDMVEIDELVVEECIRHIPEITGDRLNDKRLNMVFCDGMEFIKDKENCYDVVIVDSSDPVGPAANLISEGFYSSISRCLKKDGVMVCQSQSPMFNRETLKHINTTLKKFFPIVRTYVATVPSYPGGWWSFTIASHVHDPLQADAGKLVDNTRYINGDILRSCFALPNFIKEITEN